jgi:hypothetical protein
MYFVFRKNPSEVFRRFGIKSYYQGKRFKTLRGAQTAVGLYIKRAKVINVQTEAQIWDDNSRIIYRRENIIMSKRSVQTHFDRAVADALKVVEERARAIMRRNPRIKEFVMGMGSYTFWDINDNQIEMYHEHYHQWGKTVYSYTSKHAYKPLTDFMEEWNEHLKLTGSPMRFTATGPVITDW